VRFTPPILRKDYLVRHPTEDWIPALSRGLDEALDRGELDAASAVLNNLAFVLFKGGMTGEAMRLCKAHCRAFVSAPSPDVAKLAIQPWLNEGRVLARLGAFDKARARLAPPAALDRTAVVVAGRRLAPLDAETLAVCRNVAVVDGFFLELASGGLDAAADHLVRCGPDGAPASSLELALQLRLARNEGAEAEQMRGMLVQASPYAPALVAYDAAIAGARGDRARARKSSLLLVALLGDWADTTDDAASILHALVWLARLRLCDDIVGGPTVAAFLERKVRALGDEELRCLFAGRPYDPLPPGAPVRRLAQGAMRQALRRLSEVRIAHSRASGREEARHRRRPAVGPPLVASSNALPST
jgi:hypothetical protein